MKCHDWIFLLFTTIICCTATISIAQAQQRGRVKFSLNPLNDESDLSPSSEKPPRPPRMRTASPRTVNRVRTIESSTEDNKDAVRSPQRNRSRSRTDDLSSKKLEAEATDFVPSFRQRKRVNAPSTVDQPTKVQLPMANVERKNIMRQTRSRSEAPVTSPPQSSSSTSSSSPSSSTVPHFRRRSDVNVEESTENIRKIRTFTSRSATRRADENVSSEIPQVITTTKGSWKSPVIRRGAAKAKIVDHSPKPLDDDQLEDENYPEHFKLLLKKKQQPKTALPPRNMPRPPLLDEPTYAKSNEIDDVTKASGRLRRPEKNSQEDSAEDIQVQRTILPKVRQVELRREDTARAALKSRRVEPSVDEVTSGDIIKKPRRTEKESEENLSSKFNFNDNIRSAFKTRRIDSKIEDTAFQGKSEETPKVSFKSRRTEQQLEEVRPQEKPNEIVKSTKASKPLFIPRRAEPYRPKPSTTTARTTTSVKSTRKSDVDVRAKFKPRINGRLQFPALKTKATPLSEEMVKDENEIVNNKPSSQAIRTPQITKSKNLTFDRPIVDVKSKSKSQKFSSRYRGDAYSRYQQKTEPSKPIYTPTIPAVTTEPGIQKSDLPQPRTAKSISPYNPESHDLSKPDGKYTGVLFDEKAGVWNMVEPVAGGLTRSQISVDSPEERPRQSAVTVSIFEALAEILSKTPTTTSTTTTTTTTSTTTSTTELPDIIQVPEINIDSMQIPSTTVNTHLITDVDIEYTTTNEITNNDRNGRILNSVDINQQPSTVTAIPTTTSIDPTESQETIITTIPQNTDTSPSSITTLTQQTDSTTLALPASPTQPTAATFTNDNSPSNLNSNSLELTTLPSNPPTSLPLPHLADALTTPGSRLVTSPQLISAISNFLDTSVQNASETMATSTTSTTTTTTTTATTLETDTKQVVNSTTSPEASTTLSPTTFFTYVPSSSTASPPVTISFLDLFTIHPKKVNSNTEPVLDVHPVYREPDSNTTPATRRQKTFNVQTFIGTQTYPSVAITGSTSTARVPDLYSTFQTTSAEDTVTSGATTDTFIPSITTFPQQDTPITSSTPAPSTYLETNPSQSPSIHLNSILGSTQIYDQTSPSQTVQQTESTTTIRSRFGNNRLPILPAGSIRRVLPVERITTPSTTSSTTSSTTTPTKITSTPSTTSTTTSITPVTPEITPEVTPGQRQTSETLPDQQQQQLPKPIKDFSVYGILPNNTVVRKRPIEVSRTLDIGVMVYGILPNRTVVRKYPNGTLAIVDSSQDVEVVDIDPKMLFNPFSELYRTSQSSLLLTTHRSTTSHRLIESNHIPGTGLSSTPSSDVSASTGSGAGRRGNSAKDTTDDGRIGDTSTTNGEDERIIQLLNETEDNLLNSTSLVESNTENAVLLDLLKRKYINSDIPSKSSNVVSLTTVKNVVQETSIPANRGEDVSENTIFDSSEEKSKEKSSSSSEEDLLGKLFSQNGSAVATTPNADDDNNIISHQFDTFAANVGRGSIFAGNKGRALEFSQRTKLYPIKLVMASQNTATKLFPINTNQMATSVTNRTSVSIEDFTAELNRTRDVFEGLANKSKTALHDDVSKLIDLGILESEVDSETNGDYFMDPEDRFEIAEELDTEGSGDGDEKSPSATTTEADPWTYPPESVPVQVVYSPDSNNFEARNDTSIPQDFTTSSSTSQFEKSTTQSPIELTTLYTTPSNLEEEYLIPVKVLYPDDYFEQVSKFVQNSRNFSVTNSTSSTSKPEKDSPPNSDFAENSVLDFSDDSEESDLGLGLPFNSENRNDSSETLPDPTLIPMNSRQPEHATDLSTEPTAPLNLETLNETDVFNFDRPENMTEKTSTLQTEADGVKIVNASPPYGESDFEDTTSDSDVLIVNDKDYPMESIPNSKDINSRDRANDFEDDQLLKLVNNTRSDFQNRVFSSRYENNTNLETSNASSQASKSDVKVNLNVTLWTVLNETANSVLLDAFEPSLNESDKVDSDNHVVPRKGVVLNAVDDDTKILLDEQLSNTNETFGPVQANVPPRPLEIDTKFSTNDSSSNGTFKQISSGLPNATSSSELIDSDEVYLANANPVKDSFRETLDQSSGISNAKSLKELGTEEGYFSNATLLKDDISSSEGLDQSSGSSNATSTTESPESEKFDLADTILIREEGLSTKTLDQSSGSSNATSSSELQESEKGYLANPTLIEHEGPSSETFDKSPGSSNETSSSEIQGSPKGDLANPTLIEDEGRSSESLDSTSGSSNTTSSSQLPESEIVNANLIRDEIPSRETLDRSSGFSNTTPPSEPPSVMQSKESYLANATLLEDDSSPSETPDESSGLSNANASSNFMKHGEENATNPPDISLEINESAGAPKGNTLLSSNLLGSVEKSTAQPGFSENEQNETYFELSRQPEDSSSSLAATFSPTLLSEINTSIETLRDDSMRDSAEGKFNSFVKIEAHVPQSQIALEDPLNSVQNAEFPTEKPELSPRIPSTTFDVSTTSLDLRLVEVTTDPSVKVIQTTKTADIAQNFTQSVLDNDQEDIETSSEMYDGRKGKNSKSDSMSNRVKVDNDDRYINGKMSNTAEFSRNLIKSPGKISKNSLEYISEKAKLSDVGMIVYPSSHHMSTSSPSPYSSTTEDAKPPAVYYPMTFPKKTPTEPVAKAAIVMPTNMQAVVESSTEPKHIEMVFPKDSKPKVNEMLPGHLNRMYTEDEEESNELNDESLATPSPSPSVSQATTETNSVSPSYDDKSYIPVKIIYPPSYFGSNSQEDVSSFTESSLKSDFEVSVGQKDENDSAEETAPDMSSEVDGLKDVMTTKSVEDPHFSTEKMFVPGGIPEYILRTMETYSQPSLNEPVSSSENKNNDDLMSKKNRKDEENYLNSDTLEGSEENEIKSYQVSLNLIESALDQVQNEASSYQDREPDQKYVPLQESTLSNAEIQSSQKEQFISSFSSQDQHRRLDSSEVNLNEVTPESQSKFSQSYDSLKSSDFKPESLTKDTANPSSPQEAVDPLANVLYASESPSALTIEANQIRPVLVDQTPENPLANMSSLSISNFNPSSQSPSDRELITDENSSDSQSNQDPYSLISVNQITQHASNIDVEPRMKTAPSEVISTPENTESSSEAHNQNYTETQYTIQQHNYFQESSTISSLDNPIVIDNLKNSSNTITEPMRVENVPTPTIILVTPGSTLPATVAITTTPIASTMPSTTTTTSTTTSTTPTTTTTTTSSTTTTTPPPPPSTTTTTTTSTTPAPTTTTTTTQVPTIMVTTTPSTTTMPTTPEMTTPSSTSPSPHITAQPTSALASVNSELERNIKLLEQLLALQASLKPKSSSTTSSTTPTTSTTTTTTSTTTTTPAPPPSSSTRTTAVKTITNEIKLPSGTNADDIQFLNTLRQLLLRQQQGAQKPSTTSSTTTTTTTTTPRTTTTSRTPITISPQNLQDLLNSFSTPTFTTTTPKAINPEDAEFLNSLRDIGKLRVTTSTPPTFANRIIEIALQNRQITPTTPIHITARTTTTTPPFTPLPARKIPTLLPANEIERHRQDQAALSADLSLLSSLLGRRITIADLPQITKQFGGGSRQPAQRPIPIPTTTLRTTTTTTSTTTERPMTRNEIAEIEKNLNLLSSLLGRPVSLNELPLIMQELRSGRKPKGTAPGARINLISPAAAKSTTTSQPRTTVSLRSQTPISQEEVIELLKDPSIGTAPEQLNIYGKTNDAVLAAVLKQRGIGPTHNNIPINDLFLQGPTPTPYHTTRAPPPPPPPTQRRPLLDGLAWLWRTWQDTAPGTRTSRNNRQPTAAASTRLESPLAVGGFGVALPAAANSDEGGEYADLQYPQNENQSLGQGNGLLTAAFGVTRAVTQFLGAAFQGAAKSVQTAFAPQSLQQTNLIGLSG